MNNVVQKGNGKSISTIVHSDVIERGANALFAESGDTMKDSVQLKRLGEMYVEQGDLESAELLFRKALSADEVSAPDTMALAEDLYNLGLLCYALDNHSEATSFLMRAWKIE